MVWEYPRGWPEVTVLRTRHSMQACLSPQRVLVLATLLGGLWQSWVTLTWVLCNSMAGEGCSL